MGITGVHLMDGGPETADLLEELEGDGGLNMRVALHYWVRVAGDSERAVRLLSALASIATIGGKVF